MRIVLAVCAALSMLTSGMAYAKQVSIDMDLKKPGIATKDAEADEWFSKGNTAYQSKDYDEAIKCYKKATEIDPSFASAFYNLGIVYGVKGMPDDSISAYKKVLMIKPDYHTARVALGTVYIQKGMLNEAISELERVLASSPDYARAHFFLGECYIAKGDKPRAAEYYYKAGTLFAGRGNTDWAQRSHDGLKKTDDEKRAKDLLEKINAGPKQEAITVDQVIKIKPEAK